MSDPLDLMLELEWKRSHTYSVLHGHTCVRCAHLRPCCAEHCAFRATAKETEWICMECKHEKQ